ncbi:MAG: PEP-CTERM sorting domain-containing protein [Microcystis aeruginosa Ma_QC_C_20070703_M131]|uniref:PEP-CTERM sorting domain-containing protein n=1 Tax=Microcystis aeruginosa Ma_QC_C_20070703_M131 TaxID=2486263 RepID=A0A551X3B8_MICAE|nr:MAG: PEP-CTERM sorting domain-containing protein [Microcystis aeruginosa Ma_QC_C_20070703_M131]
MKLYIDGIEVSGAFDDVSPSDGNAFTQLPVNVTIFNLNSLFFSSLADGNVNIALNSFGGTRADAIAIDYAELEIQTISEPLTSVPEPSTILGIVTLGLGALLSKKRNQDDNNDD